MVRLPSGARSASLMILATLLVGGCGATAEPGAETFYREHAGEARRAASSLAALQAAVGALGANPSGPQLEALALQVHRAHRALLAAVNWTPAENGEEEGVSQAEKEIHEGAQALLAATGELRLYALKRNPASLVAYRRQLGAGSEYWNQGIRELWYVAKRPDAPKI
jgi:hypothetical protein